MEGTCDDNEFRPSHVVDISILPCEN